ncbi:thioesterase family protein [Candidatus Poriferisodalis sp.]|uniref:thioesterase family protein n=1 Tax=Candidatus Poriferisodalis sp. TaxID=3101277 RepID=UPI003B5A5470
MENIGSEPSSANSYPAQTSPPGGMPPALFVLGAGGVRATELTRGPWAHQVMHGGAIGGLLGWAVEREQRRLGISQVCSRLTVEILSGMPMAIYEVAATIVKGGKRTALVDAEVREASGAGGGGRLVARAASQWLTPTALSDGEPGGDGQSLPPIPAERADPGANPDIDYPRPGFNADAVDFRFVGGSTEEPGPGRTWLRLDHPLMAGEETSSLVRVATLADLGAAVGWDFSPSGGAYINTDVTLQLLRVPAGEWFYFDAATVVAPQGLAGTHTAICDRHGLLGWVLQSQVEAPAEIGFPGGMNAARVAGH